MHVNRCTIETLDEEIQFEDKPMNPTEGAQPIQVGRLKRFRITTTDTLNFVFGLVEWPDARPEVRPIEMIDGLEKYKRLESAGRWSLIPQPDGSWLGEVNALRYNGRDYQTLASVSEGELEDLVGESPDSFFARVGCLAYGTREEISSDESRTRGKRAVKVRAGDLKAIAAVFAATRVMAVMNDLGR